MRVRTFPFLQEPDWMRGAGGLIWNSALSLVWSPELSRSHQKAPVSHWYSDTFLSQPSSPSGMLECYHLRAVYPASNQSMTCGPAHLQFWVLGGAYLRSTCMQMPAEWSLFVCFYKAFWNVEYSFPFPGILPCWFFSSPCALKCSFLVFSWYSVECYFLSNFYPFGCYFLSFCHLLFLLSAMSVLLMEHSGVLWCSSDLLRGTPAVNLLSTHA